MKYYYIYNPFDKLHTLFVKTLLYTIYEVGHHGKEIKNRSDLDDNIGNQYDSIYFIYMVHPIYLYKNNEVNQMIIDVNQKRNLKKILYIMEPLIENQTRLLYKKIIQKCHILNIWTYSKGNLRYFEDILPNRKLKSIIKMTCLSPYYNDFIHWRFQINIKKDMDTIIFIGNVTNMRRNKLENIQQEMIERGINKRIEYICNKYDEDDWKWIVNRYQYFINIHRIEGCLNLETFRIYLLLGNGCVIFSEYVNEDEMEEYKDMNIYFSDINHMGNLIVDVIHKDDTEIEDRYVNYKNRNLREKWIDVNK
jgi:hypothetical protein